MIKIKGTNIAAQYLISNPITKTNVENAFDAIYDREVTNFNSNTKNKTVKRGMSLATSYIIFQNIADGQIGRMRLNGNSKITLDLPIIDQGTGSFQNAIDVIAEYLKVDPKLIYQVSNSNLIAESTLLHGASTGRVAIPRLANELARKFISTLLSRYPVHPYYSKLRSDFLNGSEEEFGSALPPLIPRWFKYKAEIVDRGHPPDNDPTAPNVTRNINTDLLQNWGFTSGTTPPNPLDDAQERKYFGVGLGEYIVDLRLLTGKQVVELYDYIFAGIIYKVNSL